jgi:REP element-mobilizing transposase RayT|tara:strand:+ start:691 stop:1308 length:618 start_codon:yes stop_codon:yes gene_type:complete
MAFKEQQQKFKDKYRIASTRLPGWNYSENGHYFVTICTNNRINYFGKVKNNIMHLSDIGKITMKYWQEIPKHFPFVKLDEYVIMPNHIHGILIINNFDQVETQNFAFSNYEAIRSVETQNFASLRPNEYKNKFGPQSKNLSSIIRGFKIGVKKYATINNISFAWQSRFYDHIIRHDQALNNIRQYIIDNPKKWQRDRNNSAGLYI